MQPHPDPKQPRLLILAALAVVGLTLAYWNHFDNGFYFDDVHTIVNNESIRDLRNIPRFFTDISTFGTMPDNRGYRPVVTLLNAVDYRLAGNELNPVVFHRSIYIGFLLQGCLLYLFGRRLFDGLAPERVASLTAFGATLFYMFHTANAETINYIIARSDAFSTLCIVATLYLFQRPRARRYHLYLIPLVVGLFTKEVVLMAVPLLGLYHLLFEQNFVLGELRSAEGWKKVLRSALASLPSLAVGVALTAFNLFYMTDPARISTGLAHPRLDYLSSQFIVVVHYLQNFILPLHLSPDPDFKVTPRFFTPAKMACLFVILSLHGLALWGMTRKSLLPISYGLLWFFVTLAPTSTINPLHQVANEHRTFLPYIGLTIAVSWAASLLYRHWRDKLGGDSPLIKLLPVLFLLILAGHAYGIHQRSEVWGSNETLWRDAVTKSPTNGRALMNYGLVFMARGDYEQAEILFEQALEYLPTWEYTNINMAILKGAKGQDAEAEHYFQRALRYGAESPESHYYYARWRYQRGAYGEARELLLRARRLSPDHARVSALLETVEKAQTAAIEEARRKAPTTDNLIDLSLVLYNAGLYEECVETCERALEQDPDNALAYNNLCSALIKLERWEEAVKAGEAAVAIDPTFERARNNLAVARERLGR